MPGLGSAKSSPLLQLSLLLLCLAAFCLWASEARSSQSDSSVNHDNDNDGASSSSSTTRSLRARRHPKSRQRAANSECVSGYRQRIEHHCRYPNTEKPCFQQSGVSEWTTAVEEAAKKCCDAGPCSVEDFEDLCCRTMECLERCYGPTFLQRIRNRFRYFDILIRPHPNSKGRNGRDLLLDDDLEAEAEAVEAEAVAEEAEALLAEQLKEAAEAAAEEEEDAAAHMAKRIKP